MPSNYSAIKNDNKDEYGKGVGRWGRDVLAIRYDDRTHFIFELLQNAEDALARRADWQESHAVSFNLTATELRVTHCGKPFDERDVRGICGIAESTKDLTSIGRFGIGFKSVYAFTDRPEIYSGDEDFAIENFVWPTAVPCAKRASDETIIVLPLKVGDKEAHDEIANGLRRLGPSTLLFLRQIEEIAWGVEGGPSGLYMRSKREPIGANAGQITVIGQEEGKPDIEETWLVFSREAKTETGVVAGHIEIAFSIKQEDHSGRWLVQPVSESSLFVFFPTVVQTYLGFLVQGPYRTTPSRDNVPRTDPWNLHLVRETTTLLVEALKLLRDLGYLGIGALRSLPLDRSKFGEGQMFSSMFNAVRSALSTELLLPRYGGGYTSAKSVKLARTQELRELVSPSQLGSLYGTDSEVFWISEEITQDRTPDLRQYLNRELGIVEIAPEIILSKLTGPFLQSQPDEWILRLYEFLQGQPALLKNSRPQEIPLVRLEDGSHVMPKRNSQPQAFLPGSIKTDFPTVRSAVCKTESARALLTALGLTAPDPVDDVVRNILPKYCADEVAVDTAHYEADIHRILTAFTTDSKSQREKLIAALRDSKFVMSVDAGNGSKRVSKPGDVYLATQRLKDLFEGIDGILLVDNDYSCLRGEDIRDLLEACGASRYLQPISVPSIFTWQELAEMRKRAGWANNTGTESIENYSLRGLDKFFTTLKGLNAELSARKAAALWDALGDVERRGTGIFLGMYKWFYFDHRSCAFDAAFVNQLNKTDWVPDSRGTLQKPEFIVFETLGWKANPFLLSKIRFKPPILETLAKEAGIEAGVLDLLKRLGVTTEAELRTHLKFKEDPQKPEEKSNTGEVENAQQPPAGDTPSADDKETTSTASGADGASGSSCGSPGTGNGHSGGGRSHGSGGNSGKRTPGSSGSRPFISYVGAHHDDKEADPDGLDGQARMALEDKAIELILKHEPRLQRTPPSNEGYDLYEIDSAGLPIRWIEVKAMSGTLHNRPVGISHTQFEYAREHREHYWLYVVEQSGTDTARIVKIQDPAGKTKTFTFDHGWLCIAEVNSTQKAVE